MKLLGHYLSPFTRRVAVSLHALGMPFDLEELSVIGEPERVLAAQSAAADPDARARQRRRR